jgi:hypothetical protein
MSTAEPPIETDIRPVRHEGVRMVPQSYDLPDPDVLVEVRVEIRGIVREARLEVPAGQVAGEDLLMAGEDAMGRAADAVRSMLQAGDPA